MKKTFINTLGVLVLLTMLFSCGNFKQQNIQPFNLTIVVAGNYPGLGSDSILPGVFQMLGSYYEGTCDSLLFIPAVDFIRSDIDPNKRIQFLQEINSINKFRKSLDLLSASNLKEDYDENQKKWKSPAILYEKSKHSQDSISLTLPVFDKSFVFSINNVSPDTIEKVRNEIAELLCSKSIAGNIGIIFTANTAKINADQAYNLFLQWKKDSVRTTGEIDIYIRKLESEYPNDYRFTLEKLKNLTQGGQQEVKKGNEWIVLQLIEKLIREGKADEIRKILEGIGVKPPVIKPPPPPKPVEPKIYISFQGLSLEEQLNLIAKPSYSSDTRRKFKEIIITKFISPSSLVIIQAENSDKEGAQQSINDYLDKLRFTDHYQINVVSKSPDAGRINELTITEK